MAGLSCQEHTMLVVERTNTLEALSTNRTGAAVGALEAAGPLSKVFQ